MTNKKSTKRALICSILALAMCFSMLVGTTFAWFTDSVTSANNIIMSGNLDVQLYYQSKEQPSWTAVTENTNIFMKDALWEPGHVEVVKLKVVNEGSLALKYQLGVNVVSDKPFTNVNGETVKLSSFIKYAVIDGAQTYTRDQAVAAAEAAGATALAFAYNTDYITLAPNAEEIVTMVVYMPTTVGNEANHAKGEKPEIKLGINVVATQVKSEQDSFGDDYDADSLNKVHNAEGLQAAINAGETNITLIDNITLDKPLVIPAPAATGYSLRATATPAIVIDLNGKTITNNNGYVIENEGNIVITGNGTMIGLGCIRSKAGSITIENGNFFASSQWQNGVYQHTLKAENTNVVINGGNFDATVNGQTNAMFNASENGVITINGGSFKNVAGDLTAFDPYIFTYEKNGKVIINDGTFYGGWRFNGETTTTDIYGGTFTVGFDGQSFNASSTHVVKVYGGTFVSQTNAKLTDKLTDVIATGCTKNDNGDGTYTVTMSKETIKENLSNAQRGDTVVIPEGTYTFPASDLKEGVTLQCTPGTVFEGTSGLNINGATVIGGTFANESGDVATGTINGTFKDCEFTGSNALRWCYAGETVVFENCIFSGDVYGVHFDGGATEIVFINCTFSGFNALAGAIELAKFEGCTFVANGKSGYNGINMWGNTEMTNCTFVFDGTAGTEWVDACGDNKTYTFTNCVVTDGTTEKGIETVVGDYGDNNTIIIDGAQLVSSNDALNAAIEANAIEAKASKILLANGDYSVRFTNNTSFNVDNMTIVGMGDKVNLSVSSSEAWYGRVQGDNVTFENIHFTSAVGATGEATYNKCEFDSWAICASSNNEKTYFNNCTINGCLNTSTDFSSGDIRVKDCTVAKAEYSGSATMNFENCTIGTLISWNMKTVLTNCTVTTLDDSHMSNNSIVVKP